MTDREKQIEEMSEVITTVMSNRCWHNGCTMCEFEPKNHCQSDLLATALVEDYGYRKASDVALETVDSFQRILRHIFLNMCDGNDYERLNLLQIDGAIEALHDSFIAELKKKYLSEDINAPTKESEGEG